MRRMAAGLPAQSSRPASPPSELLKNTLTKSGELASRHAAVFAEPDQARAGPARHRDPALEGAHRGASGPASPSCSGTGSTRCSPRWWWTRRTRSRSSPGCRSTSRSPSPTRPTALTMFARVKVPPSLPRFLNVNRYRYVPIEDVIAAHLEPAVRRHGHHRALRVPRHPGPRARGGRGRHREPAPGDGARAGQAAVRARRPARGRAGHVRRRAAAAGPRAGAWTTTRSPGCPGRWT